MFTFRQKSILNTVLGLALMFAGGANLFTISVDDDDEDTPPIVVEMNFVAEKKTVVAAKEQTEHRITECACSQTSEHMVATLDSQTATGPGKGSPELLIPLRT